MRKIEATKLVCTHIQNNLDLLNEISELSERGLEEFFIELVIEKEFGYLFTDILLSFFEEVSWAKVRQQIDEILPDNI